MEQRKYQGIGKFIIKAIILIAAFIAIFFASFYMIHSYLENTAEVEIVAVANRNILPNEEITADLISYEERSVYGLSSDYYLDMSEALSEHIYTTEIGIGKGEVIRPSKITNINPITLTASSQLKDLLENKDIQLIAIDTDLTKSSANEIKPGDLVDAICYIPGESTFNEDIPDMIIGPDEDINLSDLVVYSVKTERGTSLDQESEYGEAVIASVVSIAIDSADYERVKALVKYNEIGKIYLSLKGSYDNY